MVGDGYDNRHDRFVDYAFVEYPVGWWGDDQTDRVYSIIRWRRKGLRLQGGERSGNKLEVIRMTIHCL
jgi:hypothetical protein